MKKTILTALAVAFVYCASAQNVPVPDFKNQPTLLSGGKLVKLEKQTAEVKNKVQGMGYGGTTSNLHLDGGRSDVRTTTKPVFVIKVDGDVDPETLYYLTITKKSKKGRDVEMQKQSAFAAYGATGKSVKRFHIKLEFTKVSDGVFKIIPTEALEDGEEYAFVSVAQGVNTGNSTTYAFGVGK
jgi:hypothetical protein